MLSWTVSSTIMDGTMRTWYGSSTKGYPEGFRPAQQAAAKYGSHVGVWLSPFGGYPGREYRMESGTQTGVRNLSPASGLTLAGPRYFARFCAACQGMIDQYGVNYFKFDGFGAGNRSARRPGLRQRRRGPARLDRSPAGPEARPVHQPEYGQLALAVLALVRRFDLAARFGHGDWGARARCGRSGSPTATV